MGQLISFSNSALPNLPLTRTCLYRIRRIHDCVDGGMWCVLESSVHVICLHLLLVIFALISGDLLALFTRDLPALITCDLLTPITCDLLLLCPHL